jgi:hypothetical protein
LHAGAPNDDLAAIVTAFADDLERLKEPRASARAASQ